MKPTIRDVAQKAGVSRTTVSYVLNNRDEAMRIPEETRRRILEVVQELNYHPNALARGLSQRRTDTVALVMQYPAIFSGWSGFTVEMMHGVTDAAIRLGYDVVLHTKQPMSGGLPEERDPIAEEVAILTDGRADGALLLRDRNDPLACALRQRNFPTVLMFTHNDDPEQWFVDCDNVQGGIMATEHLLSLGHRRIIHLAGSPYSAAAHDRQQGYLEAMRRAGLRPDPNWVVDTVYAGADLQSALALFDVPANSRPTAVFAWSDETAIRFMNLLRSRGLRIPEDVAVVGFDSTGVCDHTDPPLTSVRQPIYTMASEALGLLVRQIRHETPEQTRIWAAPELDIRLSCGARAL